MFPILFKEEKSIDESLYTDNGLVGNLVAQVAATYQFAKQQHDAGITDEREKLFVYSKTNMFSDTGGNQLVTDALGRCRIDCSGFVSLVLRGVTYDKSPYKSRAGRANAVWNPEDDWDSVKKKFDFCGSYGWEFTEMDSYAFGKFNDIGIPGFTTMRTAADIAEYFFNDGYVIYDVQNGSNITYSSAAGFAKIGNNYLCEILRPGDLIFWAKAGANEEQQGRFRSISHVGIVAERTSWFYQATQKGSAVSDDSDSTTIQGGVYYSELDSDHISEIELIIRPHYRLKAGNRYPTGTNLITYPPRWGSSVSSTSANVTYTYLDRERIKLNGQSADGTTVSRSLRHGETYNEYFIKDHLVELVPGRYRASMKQLSGTVTDSDGKAYKGVGFALWVRDKDGNEITAVNAEQVRANADLTTEFEISTKTQVRVTLHIGSNEYNFSNVEIVPKLELITPFITELTDITGKTKIAHLRDTETCKVTEAENGQYLLEMTYPISGNYFSKIKENMLIKAKPNHVDPNQFFRINNISKPLNGVITVSAKHISYDLSGYPVNRLKLSAVTASAAIAGALSACQENISIQNPFSLHQCDIATLHSIDLKGVSAKAALGGTEGSVLDVFGGVYHFDNYKISLLKNRGADNGVRIKYRKNLVGMKLDINTDSSYTGVFPFAYGDNEEYITLPEGTIYVANESGITENVLLLDCSSMFSDGQKKNADELRQVVNEYLDTHDINAVNGSMEVEMLDLSQCKAFDNQSRFESVSLGDTVKVLHADLDVTVKMKVVQTTYNVLSERYEKLNLGSPKSTLSDTIKQSNDIAEKAVKRTSEGVSQLALEYQRDLDEATQAITGASGGRVVLNPPLNPQELRILCDTADVNTSQKYWLWNGAGMLFRKPNGTTFSILGDDGKIIINEVTASLITANLIRAGSIISEDGKMIINLDSGKISTTNGNYESLLTQGYLRLGSVPHPLNYVEYGQSYDDTNKTYTGSITTYSQNGISPELAFMGLKNQSIFSIFATMTPDYTDFGKLVTLGKLTPITEWSGFRFYRKNTADNKTSNVTYGLGFYSNHPMIRIEAKDSNNSVYTRMNVVGNSGATQGRMWFVNGSKESAKLELGTSSLLWSGTVISPTAGTASSEYTTETENSASVESEIMNYFKNSDITVKPETLIETASHSYTELVEDENGNIVENIINVPASSETRTPYAAFSSAEDVPAILLSEDEDSVDLSSMACLMWKAITELNARLETLENGGTQ